MLIINRDVATNTEWMKNFNTLDDKRQSIYDEKTTYFYLNAY